jgi:hypothetical protein
MKSPTDAKTNAPPKPKNEPDDKEQSQRFMDVAKELEADKNADAFERALGTLVPPIQKKGGVNNE